METTIDPKAFHALTYGLFVIASKLPGGRKVGCIANTFQQVASEPPQASVALNKENVTTKAILGTGRFTASALSEQATMELIGIFGFHNSLEREKFASLDHDPDAAMLPCLKQQCVATFSIRVDQIVDVGTHLLLVGPVEEARVLSDQPPLTYAYYHTVLRGKTPPKAVSYQPDDDATSNVPGTSAASCLSEVPDAIASSLETQKIEQLEAAEPKYAWRCKVCGHIEYVEELPDDFICPICGVGKELFERIEV